MNIATSLLYQVYEARIRRSCPLESRPQHVGIILDGNRRWASAARTDVYQAYLAGGEKLHEVLGWCDDAGIRFVTAWMLSTDNLERPASELDELAAAIEHTLRALVADGRWRIVHIGSSAILPGALAAALKESVEATRGLDGMVVNVAVGYGGRDEIVDALREIVSEHVAKGRTLDEIGDRLTVDDIAGKLYTRGQPDPDLIIRTSGEQRMSGFLLWQAAHSEFYFSDVLWPQFRSVDFWRSLRSYASRSRRYGR